ncbi:DMT family transporter [Cochlodiniinecator piscidefendens]|uniref:DMT family transporter n=1 Tax=Cochlodiniinecator piscidefendens TaxID=2715756 RepID=UPI00140D95DE|nr:DMT family transporter [Cochlodiniinecator piscidefendens]
MENTQSSAYTPPNEAQDIRFALAMVLVASVAFGSVPFFARSLTEAGMAPPAVAFFRYLLSPLLFFAWIFPKGADPKVLLWGLISGFILGLGWTGYVLALELMPVSTAGILYMTYPIFTLILSWVLFKDKPTQRATFASVLILIAAIIGTYTPDGAAHIPGKAIFYAMIAPIGFGLAINILTNKLVNLPKLSRMTIVPLGASIALLPLMFTYPIEAVLPSEPRLWALLLGIGICTALLPQLLYVAYAPRLGAANTAIAGSVELPTMFVIGWIAFGEEITIYHWTAGIVILLALSLTSARRVRNVNTSIATLRRSKKPR